MEDCDVTLLRQAEKKAEALIQKLKMLSLTLSLAESCTAGLVSALLADIPGASLNLWGSFVCYKIEAKVSMLGLKKNKLLVHGLVSKETVCAMAAKALEKSKTSLAASVAGIAGPEGDGSNIPVGTVWTAVARKGDITARKFHFTGSRNEVRIKAAIAVLEEILGSLPNP